MKIITFIGKPSGRRIVGVHAWHVWRYATLAFVLVHPLKAAAYLLSNPWRKA